MNSPIFIVGANRSGTTLLRLILNAHTRIGIPEEVIYFGSFIAGIPIEQWRSPGLTEEVYSSFVQKFVSDSCMSLKGLKEVEITQRILSDTPFDFCKPYRHLLEAWATIHKKVRWGEKTPGNLFYADILLEMFPDAKFIHVVRDPRAGVSSMMNTNFFPKDIVFNALSRHKFMTKGRAILERSVPERQRMLLRYEDLVVEPEREVRKICKFLEEPFEPSMMAFYKESRQYMKKEAVSSFNKAATQPISSEMLDKWKSKLGKHKVAQIEHVCQEEMKEFGYEFENTSLRFKERSEILLKNIYWNLQMRRHQHIRHFTVKSLMFARFQHRLQKLIGMKDKSNSAIVKSSNFMN